TAGDYVSPAYSTFADFGVPGPPGLPGIPGLSGVQGLQGELLINNGANIVTSRQDPNAATPDTDAAITTDFRRFEDSAFDFYAYSPYGAPVTPGTTGAAPTISSPPVYAGSLFVADLASGLTTSVTINGVTIQIPVQGPGGAGAVAHGAPGPANSTLIGGE